MAKIDKLVGLATSHLEPGETILGAVQGSYETTLLGSKSARAGVLIATDRRVVFYAKKLTGFEMESFPYRNISSFEQGKNLMGHTITFFASGNRVDMKWILEGPDLSVLTRHVKAAMTAASAPATAASAPPSAISAPDAILAQLKLLGDLRDSGVVTHAEFEAKKAEMLARL